MFDIGFWELGLISVVALLVIGPERLPAVARTVGHWIGKARKFVRSVQSDFGEEISKTEELQRLLEKESEIKQMHEIIEQTVDDVRSSVSVGARLPDHQAKPMPGSETNDKSDEQGDSQDSGHSNRQQTTGQQSKQVSATDALNDQVK
jgi:sec-independent protein translocase protein TatB